MRKSTMMSKKICRYFLTCISSVLIPLAATAQSHKHADVLLKDTVPLFVEKQVFFNVAGVVLWQFSDYGEVEGGLRLNLQNKWFPVAEVGLGMCDKTHDETDIHYKTSSPFVRVGCDYNFIKNKLSGNRIYGGVRLAYTSFNYDMDAPSLDDPYWSGNKLDFNFKDVKSDAFWCEFVFGLETRVWRKFSVGWSARYKKRLSHKTSDVGKAWYIPGYGENDDHLFTGTLNAVLSF
jgi:hypothetical protein